ncbi:MAG: hypothetical protein ACRCYU_00655 [Nocardioides sp.]
MTAEGSESPELDVPWAMPREYEIGGARWFSSALKELARTLHPLLAQIPRVELAEKPPALPDGTPPPREASPLYRPMTIAHEWTVSIPDVVGFKVDQFLADLHAAADEMGGQMVREFLNFVSDVAEDSGNVIDAAGRDFYDVYADTLETIDMSFDDDGRHNLSLVLSPTQAEKLRQKPPTAEQEARINAVLERRREEWRAARRRRDIP